MFRFLTLYLALAGVALNGQALSKAVPEEIDGALRENVNTFYEHFKRGQFRQAEAFVDEESKDTFYTAQKTRIIDFNLKSINYAEDFRSARVLTVCKTMIPLFGSQSVDLPLTSEWRLIDAEWQLHFETNTGGEDSDASTPFGGMSFYPNSQPSGGAPSIKQPTLESLREMFSVSEESLKIEGAADIQTAKVKNNATGKLIIERVGREIAGILIEIDKPQLASGEEATLSFSRGPDSDALTGRYRVEFMVMPISQRFSIDVEF